MAEAGRAPESQSLGVTNHSASSTSSKTGRNSSSSGAMPSATEAVDRSNWNSGNSGPQGLSSDTTARETIQRATSDTGPSVWLAVIQTLLCVALFVACALHVRIRLRAAGKEAVAADVASANAAAQP